jgi:hypothetical protein
MKKYVHNLYGRSKTYIYIYITYTEEAGLMYITFQQKSLYIEFMREKLM